jgi:hypothetical protein
MTPARKRQPIQAGAVSCACNGRRKDSHETTHTQHQHPHHYHRPPEPPAQRVRHPRPDPCPHHAACPAARPHGHRAGLSPVRRAPGARRAGAGPRGKLSGDAAHDAPAAGLSGRQCAGPAGLGQRSAICLCPSRVQPSRDPHIGGAGLSAAIHGPLGARPLDSRARRPS